MTGDQTLALWPGEEDVELPFDEATAKRVEDYAIDVANRTLRDALAECLTYLEEGGTPITATRLRHYRTLVGRPAVVDNPGTPEARRDEGIARAAAKWTDEEAAAVDAAIRTVARNAVLIGARTANLESSELTTADVWVELDGSVPITKGIAGRMLAAKAAGIIANTGRTVIAPRESTGPNHGQRLTVWRAL